MTRDQLNAFTIGANTERDSRLDRCHIYRARVQQHDTAFSEPCEESIQIGHMQRDMINDSGSPGPSSGRRLDQFEPGGADPQECDLLALERKSRRDI